MMTSDTVSPGDEWPEHYRGLTLSVSPDRSVWWQLYNDKPRLRLTPPPEDIVDTLLELKRIGGRIHITEHGDVLTKIEDDATDDDSYNEVYVGTVDLYGELIPEDDPDYSLQLRPEGLSPGDLWPSIYDGSRYSFAGERIWWHNGATHTRHPVDAGLPDHILSTLRQYKPQGGSFRITPWGDVITLISIHPSPGDVAEQFDKLSLIVKNIIKFRRERGVEMLPVYIGNMNGSSLTVSEPTSLTDSLSPEEEATLSSWAENLGRTEPRSTSAHKVSTPAVDDDSEEAESDDDAIRFDDDPLDWIKNDIELNEK
ncbi:hypothetical protein [Haloferax sp. DFSO52]|uniref:hypothetical protein n=1 Tax=Haloferax sp. DFSO52 TaxID=3388505 RepID=UPI003A898F17